MSRETPLSGPFPGINPYIESQGLWRDFHSKFLDCLQESLLERLPAEYDARTDERVYHLSVEEDGFQQMVPDVIADEPLSRSTPASGRAAMATLEPVTIPYRPVVEVRERHLQILHLPTRSVVAVVEVLSTTNKSVAGFSQYRKKRDEFIDGPVHLVELDLLIDGRRLKMGKPLPPGDFYAFVSRYEERPACHVYSWTMFDAPPDIPIPLRLSGEQVVVSLGDVLELTYRRGRYERSLDYALPLRLPLDDAKHAWIAERGRERVAAVVEQSRQEFADGQCQPITAGELVKEAQ